MLPMHVALGQATLYVDDDAPPGGDGASWNAAFDDLQDALTAAAGGGVSRIFVAQGAYLPDEAGHLDTGLGSERVPPTSLSVAILTPDEGPPPRPASAGPEPVLVPTPTALPAAPAPEVEEAAQTSDALEPALAFRSGPAPAAQDGDADESASSPVPAAPAPTTSGPARSCGASRGWA